MTSIQTTASGSEDHRYHVFLESIRDHFDELMVDRGSVFTTDASDLFEIFLGSLPVEEMQHHTCHACKDFVQRYGGLVTIDEGGRTTPIAWGGAPGIYARPFELLRRVVSKAKVTGVFLSKDATWGQPITGEWRHMAVLPPKRLLCNGNGLLTPGQMMAEKREDYSMLQRGLAEFTTDVVAQALRVLDADALCRSEKCLGVAKWMAELHAARDGLRGKARSNVTWSAVASAPPGFCHVRSTMISTLLEDIQAGLPFDDIARKFADKMRPLQYQRPQAHPSAGNIAQAEKVIAELGAAGALERRFATLDDMQALWLPEPNREGPKTGCSVFGHLQPKGASRVGELEIPATTMTWERFASEVLPGAEAMEYMVPRYRGSYLALITATDPDAPPILQWDNEDRRNPVNWYVYSEQRTPQQWGLEPGWASVNAVCFLPHMWADDGKHHHQGRGVVLILDGCRDTWPTGGLALFPEVLRSEYRAIRAAIEAYSRSKEIAGAEEASACGVDLREGNRGWDHKVRVCEKGSHRTYKLDRWD